jgi:hypothetical protein
MKETKVFLPDRPIAFNREFVRMGCGINGSLMLSQCVYWSSRTKNSDGWFYKTQAEWEDETGMTRHELDGARKKLKSLGFIEEKKQGIPCKLNYRIVANKIAEKWQTGLPKSGKHSYTETTTETTTLASATADAGDDKVKNDGIRQVMEAFIGTKAEPGISPGLKWGDKTQRAAAAWLIDHRRQAIEKTLAAGGTLSITDPVSDAVRIAETAVKIQGRPYAPTITTPLQLRQRLGALRSYILREMKAKEAKRPKVAIIE